MSYDPIGQDLEADDDGTIRAHGLRRTIEIAAGKVAQFLHHATGIGLVLVRRCVELLGGEIRFQSQVGVGTVFTVSLPASATIATV